MSCLRGAECHLEPPVPAITAIIVLAACAIWASISLVRVENGRYALAVALRKYELASTSSLQSGIERTETRTHWLWHLFYALRST